MVCEELDDPENGTVTIIGNETAIYDCDKGYRLVGNDTSRICGADGEWSGEAPICQGTCTCYKCMHN